MVLVPAKSANFTGEPVSDPMEGRTPPKEHAKGQGAAISPLLANVYLHYVLDLWVHQWRKRHAHGEMIVVRYADDFVIGFEQQGDGERFQKELGDRLAQFGLELHPDKTRLIEFGRFAAPNRLARGEKKPETFTFLGLTHICGKSRAGKFQLQRHTAKAKMVTKLKTLKLACQAKRHLPIPEQGKWLRSVAQGYYNDRAVPTNRRTLHAFRATLARHWMRALARRSQRATPNVARAIRLRETWLPPPRIQHAWPENRFARRFQGRSPVRQTRTPGSARGAARKGCPYRYRSAGVRQHYRERNVSSTASASR